MMVGRGPEWPKRVNFGTKRNLNILFATSQSCRAVSPGEPRLGPLLGLARKIVGEYEKTLRNFPGHSGASPHQRGVPPIFLGDESAPLRDP
jgi:hypothetical protein